MNIDDDLTFPDEITGVLGTSLTPVSPSPKVREQLLTKIEHLPQDSLIKHGSDEANSNVVELRPRKIRILRTVSQVAAAVVLVAAGVGVGRWSVMDSMEYTSHYAQLNQAQDVVRVSDTMPDGHVVTLTWSHDMEMAAVTMPVELQAPAGHSLAVWVRHDGSVRKAGMYEPDETGPFSFIDAMPEDGDDVFVTIEPAGGSAQPTGEAIITWKINIPDNKADRVDTQPSSTT
ncbi:anti-sigma factor [Arcanobacterium phocisimile]|uniref:Anti-sigma factor n=1 Tax=Arcanobacterium phocisimile TaxID=1302235 RepID=A0ABX7IER0_9ACTO|nr:anti-sigma factor [Arcanobacterium phocisimile]QRV01623.1 anti-sigma factor [Arcanobacterium phocisimile]